MRSLLIVVLLAGSSLAGSASPDGADGAGLQEGVRLFQARDFEAAEQALLAAGQGSGEAADVAFYLGRVYLAQGRAKDAVQAFERAVGLDPERSAFHFWLAEALVKRIDEVPFLLKLSVANRMRTAYETAARLDPESLEALIAVARFHAAAPAMAGGSPQKAAAFLEEVRLRDPALAHVTQGLSHEQLGRLAAAEEELLAAVETDPESVVSWRELGYFYQRRQRWTEAQEAFEKVLTIAPEDPLALYEVGRLAVRIAEQQLARARQTLHAYLEIEPGPEAMVLGAAEPPSRELASQALRQVDERLGPGDLEAPQSEGEGEQEPVVREARRRTYCPLLEEAWVD